MTDRHPPLTLARTPALLAAESAIDAAHKPPGDWRLSGWSLVSLKVLKRKSFHVGYAQSASN